MEKVTRIFFSACVAAAVLFLGFQFFTDGFPASLAAEAEGIRTVVIDAGHGGEDGGASSVSGYSESGINLEIALRVRDLMDLCGIPNTMIRETDTAVYSGDCQTISQKKVSDLKNRVQTVNSTPNALLISIHQNYFEQSKYHGAQIFYAKTASSKELAESVQQSICGSVDPGNRRNVKLSQSVYLMEHISCTGILVECGFLSNYEEEQLLISEDYQKKLVVAICGPVARFIESEDNKNEV